MSNDTIVELLKQGTRVDVYEDGAKISKACCSAIVLVRSGGKTVIIDPGAMGYADELLSALKKRQIDPSDVDVVVNTHMHLDHTYNNFLFPNAVIYTPESIWHSEAGNWVEIFGHVADLGIANIKLISTPGHMHDHASVVVKSKGRTIVIAGDAVRESIINEGKPPQKYQNPRQYIESMKLIFDMADEIIPGHGPLIKGKRLKALRGKLEKIKVY
jgi:glyoxylase-like metal-dependent hydrolase (beta-lactamase superfamily II)